MEPILTTKEEEFFKAHCRIINDNCGASSIEDLADDNYSYAEPEDFRDYTNFTPSQIAGLISSIDSKGIIVVDEDELYIYDGWIQNILQDEESLQYFNNLFKQALEVVDAA